MRLHTSTAMVPIGVVIVALVSTPAPAGAASSATAGRHVAQALERPSAPLSSQTTGDRYITSYDGCCVKVVGVDGGRFLKGM